LKSELKFSEKILKRFELIANNIFNLIKNTVERIDVLKNYNDRLLPKLISGEIRL
jgi:hypothetical protein